MFFSQTFTFPEFACCNPAIIFNKVVLPHPGEDKIRVFIPGFTTATQETRKLIKGVGSGLPIVNESLKLMGGSITIEDNLKQGSVITLCMKNAQNELKNNIQGKV